MREFSPSSRRPRFLCLQNLGLRFTRHLFSGLIFSGLFFAWAVCFAPKSVAEDQYRLPPAEIVEIVDAEPAPRTVISPDQKWILFVERDALPSIEDLSRRMLRLAGLRIDPVAHSSFRTRFDRALSLRPLQKPEAKPRTLPMPPGGRLAGVSWSHDSKRFVYTVVTDSGSQLWGATTNPEEAPRILVRNLNTILGGPTWLSDGKSIICRVVPSDHGSEPSPPSAPIGPNIQETKGEKSPRRTYQDLLQNQHGVELFEHYTTTQPVEVQWDGTITPIGEPGVYATVSPSPNGEHLLIARYEKPWTTSHPHWQFPQSVEIWSSKDNSWESLKRRPIAEIPLAQNIPLGGVRTEPRSYTWHDMRGASLMWAEALDGGDPKREVPHRDRWVVLEPPFDTTPIELWRVEHRARGVSFLPSPTQFIYSEFDRDRRWTRTSWIDVRSGETVILEDRSVRDRYADLGRILTEVLPNGSNPIVQRGSWILRAGSGASKTGLFPFLARQNLKNGTVEELWRCADGSYESVVRAWENEGLSMITQHERPTTPPNLRLHHLDQPPTLLTHFTDPTPQIRGVKKEILTYERADGVPLSATLYLPEDHRPGQKLPLLVWAYPREYNDAKTAGQVGISPYRFTRIGGSSHLHLVTQGYAIMDGATIPIIGDAETMNNTFIDQLVAGAQAAIDKAVGLGVADRKRVGVGGHSYGAFMTANLLAHCDLFHAGIARSGAYNRTLTPFGFQAERRTLWEAPEIYFGISPFMHAQKINEPILLIHGEVDNNSGTYPMQSRRMFSAIQGNGGTARLVMLPQESHGYRARESVLHTLAEMVGWLDAHVKIRTAEPSH